MLVMWKPFSFRLSLMMLSISLAALTDSSGTVGPSSRTRFRISSLRPPRKTVQHKQLHTLNSLFENHVALGLGGRARQGTHEGDRVIGFGLIGIAESVGDFVVKILNTFVRLLSQVLEADAEGLSRIFWRVGLEKFFLELVRIFSVVADYVVKRIIPGESVFSEREKKLISFSLAGVDERVPASDA
jgi:hypothetical protein